MGEHGYACRTSGQLWSKNPENTWHRPSGVDACDRYGVGGQHELNTLSALGFAGVVRRDSCWLFLVVFLATNLVGVLSVNPRAAYLSPAVLPIAVFCALAYKKALSAQHCRELVFLAYTFVVINVLIISISSVR